MIASTTSRKHVAQIAEVGFHIELGAVQQKLSTLNTVVSSPFDILYFTYLLCADKSDEMIRTLEADNRQLVNNIEMLQTQYSTLNSQLDEMTKTLADRRV